VWVVAVVVIPMAIIMLRLAAVAALGGKII